MLTPTYTKELELLKDYRLIAGIDEVGRGPLAGPVVSAVVMLNPEKVGKYRSKTKWWAGVRDSKTLPPHKRAALVDFIHENALDFGIGSASHFEIDELNIHHASLLSMRRAVENMKLAPDILLIDGKFEIPLLQFLPTGGGGKVGGIVQQAIVGGDAKILSIAAASILAKVFRDDLMRQLDEKFSAFGFARHKGYNTVFHRNALTKNGPCEIHRMSFEAVKEIVNQRFGKMLV